MSITVTKSINISGEFIEYCIQSDGTGISVYAREYADQFDYDAPILYLDDQEAKAFGRALDELATGFSLR